MRKWTGGSIEDTARAAWEKIQARPAPLQMPALPGSPGVEQTLQAQREWGRMPHTTRQDTVKAHDKVAKLKEAAEYFGLELKTASDYAALQSLMDQARPTAEASAPNPVWEKVGIGHEVRSDQEALARLDDFASRHGESFRRNGVSMAEGIKNS